ncbi:hypothetical protein SAY87_021203 [Trapa incisa]|uniref:Uncharacterized protein n=1 Tax=Trapa incisa TaxID=236973 RepID=A0AAN7PVJ7_9MYRT|nr:hypothetical protein SAY87_021203 [Trapa incisa]
MCPSSNFECEKWISLQVICSECLCNIWWQTPYNECQCPIRNRGAGGCQLYPCSSIEVDISGIHFLACHVLVGGRAFFLSCFIRWMTDLLFDMPLVLPRDISWIVGCYKIY